MPHVIRMILKKLNDKKDIKWKNEFRKVTFQYESFELSLI
jgi:hypothetical protein